MVERVPGAAGVAEEHLGNVDGVDALDFPGRQLVAAAGETAGTDTKDKERRTLPERKAAAPTTVIGIAGATRAFAGLDVGKQIKVGQSVWDVVGVFRSLSRSGCRQCS